MVLCDMAVAVDDPGVYPGDVVEYVNGEEIHHYDPNAKNNPGPSPMREKLTNIAFDVVCFLPGLVPEKGLPYRVSEVLFYSAMWVNSALWAVVVVFLARLVIRPFRSPKSESG
jgi:hypothetical protein